MKRVTPLIARIEKEYGSLEDFLPGMVLELGFRKTADKLGCSLGAVQYWVLRCGYHREVTMVKRV